MLAWSLPSISFGAINSMQGFLAAKFALGFGEPGVFPASIKAVAEWFPRKERALATGIFNSGTNIGALITPLVVPWITRNYGWRVAFVATGAVGFVWLAGWIAVYRSPENHHRVNQAELDLIRSDLPEPAARISWPQLIPHRQTWAFAAGKFLTD